MLVIVLVSVPMLVLGSGPNGNSVFDSGDGAKAEAGAGCNACIGADAGMGTDTGVDTDSGACNAGHVAAEIAFQEFWFWVSVVS